MAGRHAVPGPVSLGAAAQQRRRIAPTPRRRARWVVPLVAAVAVLLVGVLVLTLVGLRGGRSGVGGLGAEAGCDGADDPAAITVVASPDQSQVLTDLAKRWTEGGAEVDGRCVTATVVSKESAAAAAALGPAWDSGRDGPRPDVWVPESSAWPQVASARPEAAALMPPSRPSLARSPVVLAMPRPMAEALGWPRVELGWRMLLGAVAQAGPRGWAAYGHPEWGRFQFGMTDPDRSTTGLLTLMAITDANGDGKLVEAELRGGVVFERSVAQYAPDTSALLEKLEEADAAGRARTFLSALPATERDVAQYNAGKPKVPLAAVYPPEGTADADHPYLVLRAPWVDPERERIAIGFLEYVKTETGRAAYSDAGFRGADRAPLPGSRHETGPRHLVETSPREVKTSESVVRTSLAWKALRRRANVLIVTDVSGSMKEPVPGTGATKLRLVQGGAVRTISQFSGETKVGMWEFSTAVNGAVDHRALVPFGPLAQQLGAATRRQRTLAAIQRLQPRTGTGLYDTSVAAYQEAKRHWEPDRINIVVLLTDGRNEDAAGATLPQTVARLRQLADPRRLVQIITIGYGANADLGALRQISGATGGRTFVSRNPADIDRVLLTVQLAVLFQR